MQDYNETFNYIDPTGVNATETRQRLNEKYSVANTYYPHSWHESLDGLKGDEKVLCVGIDTALYAERLRDKITTQGKISLADLNPSRLLENQALYGGDSRFSFHECSLWKLPFGNQSFDIVICTYTLHRIGKPKDHTSRSIEEAKKHVEQTLLELKRVLKNDGICLIATHSKSSFSELLKNYKDSCRKAGLSEQANAKFDHFDGFPQENAGDELLKYFEDVYLDEIDTSLIFDSIKPYMEYWDCFRFPEFGNKKLTEAKRAEVRNQALCVAENELKENGKLRISKPSGVFICKRPK